MAKSSTSFQVAGDEPLEAVVNVRLSLREKEILKEDSEVSGISMSELIRRRYLGKPIKPKTTLAMIRAVKQNTGMLKQLYLKGADSKETSEGVQANIRYITKLTNDL